MSAHPRRVSFAVRLALAMGAMALITVLVQTLQFSRASQQAMVDLASKNALTIIEKSDELLSQRLGALKEQTLSLLVNQKLYDQMQTLENRGAEGFYSISSEVKEMLRQTFSANAQVLAADIVYGPYAFTYHRMGSLDPKLLTESEVYQRIQSSQGSAVWCSPVDSAFYRTNNPEYGEMGAICLARALNMSSIETYTQVYRRNQQKPVLLIALRPDMFQSAILTSVDIPGADYFLLDSSGRILTGDAQLLQDGMHETLSRMAAPGGGVLTGSLRGAPAMFCYTPSRTTGWTHVVAFESETITSGLASAVNRSVVRTSAVLFSLMALLAITFSSLISRAVKRLIEAVQRMERGDFSVHIDYRHHDDFSYLIERFNEMNRSIQRLINENYQVKLREKDAEIMALTVQFNPHYLYNTLNVIHWTAVRGEARKAAQMILKLSRMLRYTSDQKQERTRFADDREWMEQYLYLMRMRFEDLFEVTWDVDGGLDDALVPKLFLQPLVENVIVHAFAGRETGGLIQIRGRLLPDAMVFEVQDNGCGMSPQQLQALLSGDEDAHIGVRNVHKRIQLMYGADSGLHLSSNPGSGTLVRVRLQADPRAAAFNPWAVSEGPQTL